MSDIASLIIKGKPAAPSKFIVFGDPLSGKTTLAAKAPRPLFISTDDNARKAGLHAVKADTLGTVREAIEYFNDSKEYDTLVIDTVEGIVELIEKSVIDKYNQESGQAPIQALTDVAYGKLTGQFKKRVAAFSETLWGIEKNVVVLSYAKKQVDDVSGNIIITSELKDIRLFTKFADAVIMTGYDGDKYTCRITDKRTVMAGEVEYGPIEDFLKAAGWDLPQKKKKVGSTKK